MDVNLPSARPLARMHALRVSRRIERSRNGTTTLQHRRRWRIVNLVSILIIASGVVGMLVTSAL